MNYVSADRIRQYLVDFGEPVTPEQLARMVNWFAEGAITTLSNHIMTVFDESPTVARLEYNIAQNCRCMCCREFQILDEDGNILDSTEDLAGWVRE
jgi:hypothetical protein